MDSPQARTTGGLAVAATDRVLLLLDDPTGLSSTGSRAVDPDAPHVSVLDLGVTRGDGIFEALDAVDGFPQSLEQHLARLAHSAGMLDLPAPSLPAYRAAVLAAIEASTGARLLVKLVMTRGIEGGSAPTGWVYAEPVGDFTAARRDGIRVVTLDRGYRHDVAQTSSWLLQGAKTLSYAINKAALREAVRRDADDVIFISSDDFVLEGPNSTVVLQFGTHFVTPSTDQGILAGTAQAALFEYCASAGYSTEYRTVVPDELFDADSVWLASSVRQLVPIRELNGLERHFDRDVTAAAVEYLLARRS